MESKTKSRVAILGGLGAAAMLAASLAGMGTAASERTTVAASQSADSASQQKSTTPAQQRIAKAMSLRQLFGSYSPHAWKYPRPGWSVRQGQRMARKRRNQARNKAAHRGAR